jgi:hypothetical protein
MTKRLALGAVVAVAIGAALLAVAADRGSPDAAPAPAPAQKAGPQASAGHPAAGAPDTQAHPKRTRVPAGVLVRAVRRAHEREAATPPAPERRPGRDGGEVLSVEIDWHAGASADR